MCVTLGSLRTNERGGNDDEANRGCGCVSASVTRASNAFGAASTARRHDREGPRSVRTGPSSSERRLCTYSNYSRCCSLWGWVASRERSLYPVNGDPRHWGTSADPGADTKRADELLSQALALDPTVACAHNSKAWNLRDQGRIEEALAERERALVLDPGDVGTLQSLAWDHVYLGHILTRAWNYLTRRFGSVHAIQRCSSCILGNRGRISR
jgi:tetratricopeptide (TPR) repeat protein